MSTWRIKKKDQKKGNNFRIPKIGELKKGDVYYWGAFYHDRILNELRYDVISPHYVENINKQIKNGLIWVKK